MQGKHNGGGEERSARHKSGGAAQHLPLPLLLMSSSLSLVVVTNPTARLRLRGFPSCRALPSLRLSPRLLPPRRLRPLVSAVLLPERWWEGLAPIRVPRKRPLLALPPPAAPALPA